MADFTYNVGDKLRFETTGAVIPVKNIWKINGNIITDATGPSFEYTFTDPGIYTVTHEGFDICDLSCVSMTKTVEVLSLVCSWIISRGGWHLVSAFDIMTLVSAYSGQQNLGFTVSSAYIMGAVAYYSDNIVSGNNLTGCNFNWT